MSEIMDYQEEMAEEQLEDDGPEQTFATVGAVYNDGLSLLFDGEDEPSTKHYKCNTFFKYSAGQRVFIAKDSGTYVVICAIGTPHTPAVSVIGSSSNYANECYISRLNIGSPSSHWVITNGSIYHNNASGSSGQGLIGAYINNNVKTDKPINYLNINGNEHQS